MAPPSLMLISLALLPVVLSHGHGMPRKTNSSPLLRMSLSNGRILMMKSKRILKVNQERTVQMAKTDLMVLLEKMVPMVHLARMA